MSRNGRVLVAMSGGVDSSVAAALLHEQGFEVVGITMKTWDYTSSGGSKKETGCCNLDSLHDARALAVHFGFPHYILDLREEFGESVIEHFVEEYLGGRTPNPCILCNTHIKWAALLRRADKLGCDYIATGHYAQVRTEGERAVVSRGRDRAKDQSYVLWGVAQECLGRTLFPVGGFEKSEIRHLCARIGFERLAQKPDSYEICFIPDNDYRGFLSRRRPEALARLDGGAFVTTDGRTVGRHRGYPFYTVGQRKGLVALGEPYYVTQVIPETNTVVIGRVEDLYDRRLSVRQFNGVKVAALADESAAEVQIRSNGAAYPALVRMLEGQRAEAIFAEPVKAIAPGQAAVFYDGDDVLGGGWIEG